MALLYFVYGGMKCYQSLPTKPKDDLLSYLPQLTVANINIIHMHAKFTMGYICISLFLLYAYLLSSNHVILSVVFQLLLQLSSCLLNIILSK